MAEPKLKADKDAGNLSEGAKTHALDVFISWHYKRREDSYSKYFEKGNAVEEDGITLVSVRTGIFLIKNEINFSNEFITGTPDLFTSSDSKNIKFEQNENGIWVYTGKEDLIIEDTKASWDLFTFTRTKRKGNSEINYWQMQGYMALTGAKLARLRFCLVNSTPDLIDDEKRKLAYAMRVMDRDSDPVYIEKCAQIERNMIYDLGLFLKHNPNYDLSFPVSEWSYDIPASERLYTIEIPRNDSDILAGYEKVKKAWSFMQSLL